MLANPISSCRTGAFARATITAVGFARGEAQAADIAHPPADGTLHRFGHRAVMHADGIVEISFHERQQFGAVVLGKWLVGGAGIDVDGGFPAVVAAGAGRERDRQQQDRRALC